MATKAIILTGEGITDVRVDHLESGSNRARLTWKCSKGGPYYIYSDGVLFAIEFHVRNMLVPKHAILFEVFRVVQQVDLQI